MYPKIELIGVEPAESAILEGKEAGPHKIKESVQVLFLKHWILLCMIKSFLLVETKRWKQLEVGRKEGILVGISSGAAIAAALKVAKELGKGKKVLAVVPDNGERYLSTALYQEI